VARSDTAHRSPSTRARAQALRAADAAAVAPPPNEGCRSARGVVETEAPSQSPGSGPSDRCGRRRRATRQHAQTPPEHARGCTSCECRTNDQMYLARRSILRNGLAADQDSNFLLDRPACGARHHGLESRAAREAGSNAPAGGSPSGSSGRSGRSVLGVTDLRFFVSDVLATTGSNFLSPSCPGAGLVFWWSCSNDRWPAERRA